MPTKKQSAVMSTEEVAAYYGISTEDVIRSRWRGMDPGRLGYKEGGVLKFRRSDLPKPSKTAPASDED